MAEEKVENVRNGNSPEEKRKIKKPLWKRILKIFAGILIVLVALLLVRDFIVEQAVERAGTYIVGTPVKLGSFSSSLLGKVHIKDLSVANPEGYNNPFAFKLGEVKVDLDIASLFTDKIEVRQILVAGVNVDYELKLGKSNLGEIQKNLERFAPPNDDSPDSRNEQPTEQDEAAQKQAVIRLLQTTDCSLSFSNAALGTTMKLPLPGLKLENLGDGKPIGETVNDLFGLVFTSVTNACTGVGGFIGDAATSAGSAIGSAVTSAGSAIGNAATSAGSAIGDSAKNVGKSIKGLFK